MRVRVAVFEPSLTLTRTWKSAVPNWFLDTWYEEPDTNDAAFVAGDVQTFPSRSVKVTVRVDPSGSVATTVNSMVDADRWAHENVEIVGDWLGGAVVAVVGVVV